MEPTEPKAPEPFPGYNEMPERYKGNCIVTIYRNPNGSFEARMIEKMDDPDLFLKGMADAESAEQALALTPVIGFYRVSIRFFAAAANFAKKISPRKQSKTDAHITWQDIIQE